MASRLRIGAALFGAAALLSLSTPAAFADVVIKPIEDDKKYGHDVYLVPNVGNTPPRHNDEFSTSLIGVELKEDGKEDRFHAYCVELPTILEKGKPLREVPWDKHPNPNTKFKENAGKVLWILTNSFPTKSVEDVNEKFGEGKKPYDDREIIAATQAAIWHFTDGAQLDEAREIAGGKEGGGADLVELYNKLVKNAVSIEQQPHPTLTIDPADGKGKAGEKIGPFKVTTTASEVQLTAKLPKGVTITDGQGNPLTITQSGDELKAKAENTKDKISEFFVNVPADAAAGKAELQAKAEAELQAGRLFVSEDANQKTQSLVIAKDSKITVEKPAKAEWTAAPVVTQPSTPSSTPSATPSTPAPTTTTTTPAAPAPGGSGDEDLASTGASILWPLIGGLVLVGGGAGALFLVRRKKAGA
jgi:TQXA domain-containing protein/LPXTG-motif cell wall-anchored protein